MNILFLSSYPTYPCLSGGRRRTAQILKSLREAHQVRHVTFVGGPREKELMESMGSLTVPYQYQARNNSLPPSLWPFDSKPLHKLLTELQSEEFDLTIYDQIYVACHLERAIGKSVLLEQNVESDLLKQQAGYLEPAKKRLGLAQFMALRAYESKVWPQFDLRCAVSENDARTVRERCPDGPTVVVPNGVDLERAMELKLSDEPRLLFVGALDYTPNQDAAKWLINEIMPRIWAEEPAMELRILGRNPAQELTELASADPRLELIANAPELEPLARECTISVVPLRMGSGTRLKILEASAWGMPVVTTSLGCDGLSEQLTQNLFVADGAEQFSAEVWSCWRSPEQRAKAAKAARKVVAETYSWKATLAPLHQALEELFS